MGHKRYPRYRTVFDKEIRMKARRRDSYNTLSVEPTLNSPPITKNTPVFTMGSCFALEVKRWLVDHEFNVILPPRQLSRYDLIWYNTYSIRDEFRRLVGKFGANHIWKLGDNSPWAGIQSQFIGQFQDPYRRLVIEKTEGELIARRKRIDDHIEQSVKKAKVIIITLGLTEVWFQPGRNAICAAPGYGDGGGWYCSFRNTGYNQNFYNMCEVVYILSRINSEAQIILTVSPVPLALTFRKLDHVIANTESKSILRAVAGAIVDKFSHVHYFHSYEMAVWADLDKTYRVDGRHIGPTAISRIMDEFERHFVARPM